MLHIIYYVASSLDGYISGQGGDISRFVQKGKGVDQYLKDLQDFDTVIMGRNTYEFGYDYGLKPGQPAYPHMEHHIFSTTLQLPDRSSQVHIHPPNIEIIRRLKQTKGSDIYLCGGGMFAGWLLDHQLIDKLKIKLNPLILGSGVRIFGDSGKSYRLNLTDSKNFEEGLQILSYDLKYI
jgi:dihydrofolate reductase